MENSDEQLDAKSIKRSNCKLVMEALAEIAEPASAKRVVEFIAEKYNLDIGECRGPIVSVLRQGYNGGFLDKVGTEYMPLVKRDHRNSSRSFRSQIIRSRSSHRRSRQ